MYICRNAILPNWNLDMRQVVYWVFGPYGALVSELLPGNVGNVHSLQTWPFIVELPITNADFV